MIHDISLYTGLLVGSSGTLTAVAPTAREQAPAVHSRHYHITIMVKCIFIRKVFIYLN